MCQYYPVYMVQDKEDGYAWIITKCGFDTSEQASIYLLAHKYRHSLNYVLSWIRKISAEKNVSVIDKNINKHLAKELKQTFLETPVDPVAKTINKRFGDFCPGTPQQEVLQWFEDVLET